ncbi:hypothetical protein [Sphingobium sp.]|uniref:hypothetical protein n=1 Tax=Sphingobium sp. TaxID=1912891 RepID=UPI002E215CC1
MEQPLNAVPVPPCRRGESADHCEIRAQWKAVEAAEFSAHYALMADLLALCSLAGVIYALHLTRRANKIAQDAVDLQLRPYVGLTVIEENAQLSWRGSVRILVKNYGQTPALDVRFFYSHEVEDLPLTRRHNGVVPDFYNKVPRLSPGESREYPFYLSQVSREEWNRIRSGKSVLSIKFKIKYVFMGEEKDEDYLRVYIDKAAILNGAARTFMPKDGRLAPIVRRFRKPD